MRAAPFVKRFRTLDDLRDFLRENYQPACIGPEETLEAAHRRAGEVGLAQRIIATIDQSDPENDLED